MARLEDIQPGCRVKGLVPGEVAAIVAVEEYAPDVRGVTFRLPSGRTEEVTLYRDDEVRLEILGPSACRDFAAPGDRFRLVAEASRIELAHLFDPALALHSSRLEPLPHQLVAVYEHMLPRQPLRFLLADDPGAGKTIMAGLLIKEMLLRGDIERCLIVCPSILVEQWQAELYERFQLSFEIATSHQLAATPTGNWFCEHPFVIARLDKSARDKRVREMLEDPECRWDLVVVDEAHKMAATFTGSEIKRTLRYELGRILSARTENLLLLTATPHNGKPMDFQLFLQLLDGERFAPVRPRVLPMIEVSDVMRRVLKEDLVRFDGTPLFPERRAYTRSYALSPGEAELYAEVTDYVRGEFNRAEALGDESRANTVGFALMTLQRRLASSPEAIYRSLQRRRHRLEAQAEEWRRLTRWSSGGDKLRQIVSALDAEELEELEESGEDEGDNVVLDQATAARTLEELEAEIATLRRLEGMAAEVRRKGDDRKWAELRDVLQALVDHSVPIHSHREDAGFFDDIASDFSGPMPPKLIVFTEYRDTLEYLVERIRERWPERVTFIHGGLPREKRLARQEGFATRPELQILVATDAAGEGLNLQCAHLVVNYDLPWNPNRIEQRFGRVHRIGQMKPCSLWNLVAEQTREGEVYLTLLVKLEEIRRTLGGKVFDVLGKLQFEGRPLAQVMLQAIRESNEAAARAHFKRLVSNALELARIRELIEDKALAHEVIGADTLRWLNANAQRGQATGLYPYAIESFFLAAFRALGGKVQSVEEGVYGIGHVPLEVRQRARSLGCGAEVRGSYPRITFRRDRVQAGGARPVELIHPAHPLLRAVVKFVLQREAEILERGSILVDEQDPGLKPRIVFGFRHSVVDGTSTPSGSSRVVSQRFMYIEVDSAGVAEHAGRAPHLNCSPLRSEDPSPAEILGSPECRELLGQTATGPVVGRDGETLSLSALERSALQYAAVHVAGKHRDEVASGRLEQIQKTRREVERSMREQIKYWEQKARDLQMSESVGRPPASLSAQQAQRKAEELRSRLRARLEELDKQAHISATRPVIEGVFLVVTRGLLKRIASELGQTRETATSGSSEDNTDTGAFLRRSVALVMERERQLGREPTDVTGDRLGFDIESREPRSGTLWFIKVVPVVMGQSEISLTRETELVALNKPEHFRLALVCSSNSGEVRISYVRPPRLNCPQFERAGVVVRLEDLQEQTQGGG